MPMAYGLESVECVDCGEEEVVWWRGDEHDDTIAVLADCRGCGREYPKKFVDKSKSHDELREVAKEQVY
jgi:DNA-directed RNA polymerase subunit M/transcription elongation factor TFIIS